MDSLLLVVAELLAVSRTIASTLLFVGGAGLVLVLGQLVVQSRLVRWWRRLVWTVASALALAALGLVIVDMFLYEQALRFGLEQVALRSGITVTFQQARGSLLTGRLELYDVTIDRADPSLRLYLTAEELTLDVDMLVLWRPGVQLELVRIAGVRGEIHRGVSNGSGLRPRRNFVASRVELEDIRVNFEDTIAAPFPSLPIVFETLTIAPLRSRAAMTDILCASEGRGSARGYNFGAGGRAWMARAIPIGPAAHKLGATGRWLRGGEIDVTLRCGPDHPDHHEFTVDLRLHDFSIAPPGDSGRHLPANRIAEALTKLGPQLSLNFSFNLPRHRFDEATNVGELGMWEAALEAWDSELGTRLGLSRDELLVLGVGSRVVDKLRKR